MTPVLLTQLSNILTTDMAVLVVTLVSQVGCEAGCEAAPESDGAQALPGYVVPRAPKIKRPAMCFTAAAEASNAVCTGKELHVQRLCVCELRGPPPWSDLIG